MVVLCVASACKKKTNTQGTESPSIPVVEVVQSDVPISKTFVGQTYGSSDITIQARVNGFLKGIYFKEGAPVRKGQLLYVIEPAPLAAQSAEAYAALANAQTALVQAQSNYDRVKPLADMNAVSRSELDAAVAQLGSAKASVKSAEASLDLADIQLGYTRITSPINGVIGKTNARVGDYVGLESQIPVLNTVSQIDSVLVRFYVPDGVYLMAGGDRMTMTDITLFLPDGTPYPDKGRFNFVGRAINQGTGSIDVQVSFQNPDSLLRPGQFAKVTANVGTLKDALLIPQQSVTQTQGLYSVYVVGDDNKLVQKIVDLGDTYGPMWVVKSGLQKGDKVVLEGFHKVRSGVKINPVLSKTK